MNISLLLDCGLYISRMLFWGIMSGEKLNLLWLMIVCCASSQISCLKIMLIGDNLSDAQYPNRSTCAAIKLTCPSACETLIGDFCIMTVQPETTSLGKCKTDFFKITNLGNYEIRMNETVEDIQMWFLPKESKCLPSAVLNITDHTVTCQNKSLLPTCAPTTQTTTCKLNTRICCSELRSVNPGEKCKNATYANDACSAQERSKYVLKWNGTDWTCVKCRNEGSTTVTPESHTTTNNPDTSVTPSTTTSVPPSTTTSVPPSIATSVTPSMTTSVPPSTTTSVPPSIATSVPPSIATSVPPSTTTSVPPSIATSVTPPMTTQNQSSTLAPHENVLNISSDNTTDWSHPEPSKASETLERMNSWVKEMEKNNKSNAGIVMEDVIGVLQIQAKNTESKDTKICYSSKQNMINVLENKQPTGFPWYVNVPSEAFDKSRLENNGSAYVGILRFRNMGNKNETVLNNEVYGITMGANISNLTNKIEMFINRENLVGNASCSSWDGKGNLTWTTSGCETVKIDNNTIKCSCSHLTFFAVLMSLPGENQNSTAQSVEALSFITSIGCGISMFFLSVALFMHFLLRKAKSNQATKILMNMFVALFLLNLSFLSNESVANTEDKAACVFIALLMHYSMLATFTWFFIQALHMYLWLIRQNITIKNYMRKITVFGWMFSAPIVIAVVSSGGYKTFIITTTSGKNTKMCWITDPLIHYIVNIGYYALVFIFTTGIFIMIVTKIVQARHLKAADGKRKTFRKQLMMVLSLFLLFGLTWAVAFFSYGPMLIPSLYIFTVLNSFQGFFLFLYYYHIHNDVAGNFSDDPESSSSSSTTTIVQ
ncbi:adhesion G-protein coupled receptor G2-like [Pimephales promelas]|uniref:adhesion G-protein coupled receptor G2-like n=1 Tax=Pimephales promelas TaxID=90988 RepID=UPI0019557628|nr:adhesion G-protein coupled receptor G2-like [Pimephales promelas]